MTTEQTEAIRVLKGNGLVLFSGPPGSGKTTTLAHWLRDEDAGDGMTLYMAPTGKAAQRMTEAFSEAKLKAEAYTIHASLSPKKAGHGTRDWGFKFHQKRPWVANRVVVDEASMIDGYLMKSLMDAVQT